MLRRSGTRWAASPAGELHSTRLAHAWSFVQLTRPVFLLGGALMYALGAAVARAGGASIDWGRYWLGQVLVTAIQLMAHYANEYFDLAVDREVGAARTWFSGGSGVLADGRLAPQVALSAARLMAWVATAVIAVGVLVEPTLSLIGGLALLGAWFYSAPPLRLAATGFGESVTALIVSVLVPLSAVFAQHAAANATLLAVMLPLFLINVAMLLTFEFPDFEADRRTGKRTLAVQLGLDRTAHLHTGLLAAAFLALGLMEKIDWIEPRIAAWLLLATPLAAWQVASVLWHTYHGWRSYWLTAAGGVGLFALAAAALLIGFLV